VRLIACLLWSIACARAVSPSPADQEQMQAVVRRMVAALNDRDLEGMAAASTADFDAFVPGQGFVIHPRMKSLLQNRGEELRMFELATLLRLVRLITGEVALGDGFFRTIGLPGGDTAGRVTFTFVRRDGKWLVAAARFNPLRFERPYIAVEAAAHRTVPEPDGWVTLFDGRSAGAFIDASGDPFPKSWTVADGALKAVTGQTNRGLRTRDTYRSFDLRFEWKLPPKGNSGVKYRLFYLSQGQFGSDGAGHEYQLADDAGDPGAIRHAVERAGSLYNQIAPAKAVARPVGEFNESVVIVRGRRCEHWLNGEKIVGYETESGPLEGPILLQHHGTEAWFRNIRIRRLDP
jgi:hypothetical protein